MNVARNFPVRFLVYTGIPGLALLLTCGYPHASHWRRPPAASKSNDWEDSDWRLPVWSASASAAEVAVAPLGASADQELAPSPPVANQAAQDWAGKQWVEEKLTELAETYRDLHRHPELSFAEEKTSAKMADKLTRFGFEITTNVGGHGVVGILRNGSGKTLLLRADMDGLPVVEETGLPYASAVRTVNDRGASVGVMHACGHDVHMTSLLGAAQFLSERQDLWRGTLVAVFQPAEERGAGAKAMLEDGLFTRFPRPDFALALHVDADRPAGALSTIAGYAMANVDSIDVTLHGRGGHGAWPHMTIDPIVIAAHFILDLQTIVSREIKPIEPAVITVGAIHGGAKHNVIGDRCDLQLTVRSYTPGVRKQLLDGIERKAKAAAQSAGAPEPQIEIVSGTPALFNDASLEASLLPTLKRVLGDENVLVAEPSMGGEDFGRLGLAGVPILMMYPGTVSQQRLDAVREAGRQPPSLHSPQFYPDIEPTLRTSVSTLAASALELLAPTNHGETGDNTRTAP